ncbi:MAG: hypothetical protein COV91_03845 [Candidatus Taylorbacteria bacterium CG11_big_fil_rev_8_21_14_0_20_46_11]|uniref:Uncharacterized protein n=1 Tax=Candidatus Taylorbacteria bacterium CG11_big_fil_rev_8_21_14_0_20_46_11 TaxID=1975025 RepID=A0A2H0KB56_9BACT|nr:MAG: hypothetical protein COV91_03845 [Candidatus Taylorbacteria bacterium CG11_big_fil_rev_8_21_14_0_20_46_11]
MPDETSIPKSEDTSGQAPPPQSAEATGQASEPVSAPEPVMDSINSPQGEAPAEPQPQVEAVPAQESQPEVVADAPALEPEPQTPEPNTEPPQTTSLAPQSGDTATGQASEPVAPPVAEPTPPPEAAAPAPEPNTPTTPSVGTDTPPQAGGEETPAPPKSEDPEEQRAVNGARLAVANAKIQATKQKRLDKIMSLLSEKGKVTNDEVEKLLRVSDATATRYLDTLEQENRIKQNGSTGMAVFYEKI